MAAQSIGNFGLCAVVCGPAVSLFGLPGAGAASPLAARSHRAAESTRGSVPAASAFGLNGATNTSLPAVDDRGAIHGQVHINLYRQLYDFIDTNKDIALHHFRVLHGEVAPSSTRGETTREYQFKSDQVSGSLGHRRTTLSSRRAGNHRAGVSAHETIVATDMAPSRLRVG